jgi:hypothetical protein
MLVSSVENWKWDCRVLLLTSQGCVVEVGRTWVGDGRARKDDRALGRLVACLDVRVVERCDQLRWQTAGGEAGGQMRVAGLAVAEADGRGVGLEEEVFDGIASIVGA